jgi:hypothetical protein
MDILTPVSILYFIVGYFIAFVYSGILSLLLGISYICLGYCFLRLAYALDPPSKTERRNR